MNIAHLVTAAPRPNGWHWTDVAAYAYLLLGVVLMFGPVLWLVLSSFKTQAELARIPALLLPMSPEGSAVCRATGSRCRCSRSPWRTEPRASSPQVRRIGIQAQMIDPANPGQHLRVPIDKRVPVRRFAFATDNYTEPLRALRFPAAFSRTRSS